MSELTIIYCDESGNSGDNYLDRQQPLYVLAGWTVPKDAIVDASLIVERLRLEFCPQRKELKSATFLGSDRGKARASEFFKQLGRIGCAPLIVAAEKRYVVTGKIVETFLDPAFNKRLRLNFTTDTLTKRELANTFLFKLPPEAIDHFAEAYRNPSSQAFLKCLNEISSAAKTFVNPELAACIAGCLPEIQAIAESEDPSTSPLGKISQSVNAPVLMAFLSLVQNLARLGAIEPLKVVHDEQAVFEKDMQEIFRLHREAKDFVIEIPHSEIPYSSFTNIPKFELVPSVDCQMIQAADVLAGTVNHLMKLVYRGHKPSPEDLELAAFTMPTFFLREPPIAWFIGSDKLRADLVRAFILPVATQDQPSDNTNPINITQTHDPMFPVVGPKREIIKPTRETYKWDLPVFGVLGKTSRALMVVNTGDFELEGKTYTSVLPLFTSRHKAEAVLSLWPSDELAEPQEIIEYGPQNLNQFIELLLGASETTKLLVVDPGTDDDAKKYLLLEPVIAGMKGMLNRVERIFSSGFDNVMIQMHELNGAHVMTMLTSKGDYGALIPPSGKIYFGETRELALKALVAAEGSSSA